MNAILVTQIASLVTTVLVVFGLYRLLVSQKDAAIQLLKERLEAEQEKVEQLKSQTPDALAEALSARISVMNEELVRMRGDGVSRQADIAGKEKELHSVREQLLRLTALVQDSDLICPDCGAPLEQRVFESITGVVGGRELEADVEHRVYECGASFRDSHQTNPCGKKSNREIATNRNT